MDEKLDNKLCQDFPNLYADRHADMRQTCMCWGFPGNGWFDLLYDLSAKLEKLIVDIKNQHPDCEYLPRASQVKEKFGTLRFYMSSSTDEMHKLIDEAEAKSAVTCEECGKPGRLHGTGWYSTSCLDCTSKETLEAEALFYKERYSQLEKEFDQMMFDKEVDETLAANAKPEEQP